MTLPLDTLHADTFQPFLDTAFELSLGADGAVELRLIEVRSLGHRHAGAVRDPFALGFRGPAGLRLPQAIYRLEHPGVGLLEIFLVQVADKPDGSLYEAIFT